jgi:hypothetical protein
MRFFYHNNIQNNLCPQMRLEWRKGEKRRLQIIIFREGKNVPDYDTFKSCYFVTNATDLHARNAKNDF